MYIYIKYMHADMHACIHIYIIRCNKNCIISSDFYIIVNLSIAHSRAIHDARAVFCSMRTMTNHINFDSK